MADPRRPASGTSGDNSSSMSPHPTSSSPDKKRKLATQHQHAHEQRYSGEHRLLDSDQHDRVASDASGKQPAIADCFPGPSKKAATAASSGDAAYDLDTSEPIAKKTKLTHLGSGTAGTASSTSELGDNAAAAAPQHPSSATPPHTSTSPKKMYNFPSPNTSPARSNGPSPVVSLTTSPHAGQMTAPGPTASKSPKRPIFDPYKGAKRLPVKGTSHKGPPINYLEITWPKIARGLDEVFADSNGWVHPGTSVEELYKCVTYCCKQKQAQELFERVEKVFRAHIDEKVRDPLFQMAKEGVDDLELLRALLTSWTEFNNQLVTTRKMFVYLDRAYLLQWQLPWTSEMGLKLFRDVAASENLRHKVFEGAYGLIVADRQGRGLDEDTFMQAVDMYHGLEIYTECFENLFLARSAADFESWTENSIMQKTLAAHVKACNELIANERNRCERFGLDASTQRSLMDVIRRVLVEERKISLVNHKDLNHLFDTNDVDSLELLYRLLERAHFGSDMKIAFEQWIKSTGTNIVFDEGHQDRMVVKLLTLKKRLDTFWRVSFHRNEELGGVLRKAVHAFMNTSKKTDATWGTDNSKPGEMIAKYVDALLRGGAKAIPQELSTSGVGRAPEADGDDGQDDVEFDEDAEVNHQLDQVLDLFRFIEGKAVFEAFYKKDLARRLLMGRSASADAERSMLTRLRTECGAGFTQNLEQMFKDIELAREEMAAYKVLAEARQQNSSIDLSVNILSAAAWPTYPDVTMVIPIEISKEITKFEDYYRSKHSNRKLQWKHALAHCQIRARFPKGMKELVVSSFQAIVLLLFNEVETGESLSYEFIKRETGLPEAEVVRTLQSLACAMLRPLAKKPKGRDINPGDQFAVNPSFTTDKYRVKINQVQLKETKEENKETHERVAADRNFETQAAIVRIMKSRKKIGHQELIAEVIKATKSRGVLNVADIKKNIERLVDKDYMERDDDNQYSYLA
ncbi:Cullin family-domain-containing protein [Lineolata rhizophorae]|uniref:Cullin family-domain-containing protein n=1 Tax=Lineolata rhizophorae TaxID=578093 RepID=A0A6A6NN03_9PEZI|nr:Cullin family-domain-containing protein [Lineolata rhizophorae]